MKYFFFIPARGGSKGIKRKNLLTINGESLIAIAASSCRTFDPKSPIYISTDSIDIEEEALKHGCTSYGLRPSRLALDTTTSDELLTHEWLAIEEHYSTKFDLCFYIEPTSPLRDITDFSSCYSVLEKHNFDVTSCYTASALDDSHSPSKIFRLTNSMTSVPYIATTTGLVPTQRKNLSEGLYLKNGACYLVTRNHFMSSFRIVNKDSLVIISSGRRINIDCMEDYILANYYLSLPSRN